VRFTVIRVLAIELARNAHCVDLISNYQRRDVRARTVFHFHASFNGSVVGVFPERFSGLRIQGHDHFPVKLAAGWRG